MSSRTLTLDFELRPYQVEAHREETRFCVHVWHRRAGKTYYVVAKMLRRAIEAKVDDWRAYYIAPTYRAAKGISWDYLKRFSAPIPGRKVNESELRIDLPNGSRMQLLGAESADKLRGLYANELIVDESALISSHDWHTVFSPMLSDRGGRATFIGTPMGHQNLFYELWDYAGEDDPEWSRSMLKHFDTKVLPENEIRRMQRTMRPEQFAQEMECSWNAAIPGAYYTREMGAAEADGRVTSVKYDNQLPVIGALDLGWSDAMVCVWAQQAGTEWRILRADAYEHTSIPDMVAHWRKLPFPIEEVILPHDAKVRELGSGKSRVEVFHSLGCKTRICPNQSVHEGIEAVRVLLPHCWFDQENTGTLREALLAYRSKYDEVRRVHSVTPEHDWSSHWADAFRYLAVGKPMSAGGWKDNSHLRRRLGRGM